MFGSLFRSKPEKPVTWGSVEELFQDLAARQKYEIKNRAYFDQKNFRLFIPVIERSRSCKWIEWSRSPDNELEALKFTTVIRHQDGTHLLLEVMQHPCNEGTMVYFIDLEKAISCQRHLIRTCLESEVDQYVSLDYNSLDALYAMEILADYDGLYTPSRNYRMKVEQYVYNLVLLSDRACYRCTISTDDGQDETVCFELTGFASGGIFVTPRTSIPGTYSLSSSIYKKRREIG